MIPQSSEKDIHGFLSRFHSSPDIDQVFTEGCCYWFAQILLERFSHRPPILMYSLSGNHFGVMLEDRVFDITGDVTDQYQWIRWDDYQDESHKARIIRDCVNF